MNLCKQTRIDDKQSPILAKDQQDSVNYVKQNEINASSLIKSLRAEVDKVLMFSLFVPVFQLFKLLCMVTSIEI